MARPLFWRPAANDVICPGTFRHAARSGSISTSGVTMAHSTAFMRRSTWRCANAQDAICLYLSRISICASQSRIGPPIDETHIHYDSARNTGARDPHRNRALRHVFIEVGDRIWRSLPEIEFAKMRNDRRRKPDPKFIRPMRRHVERHLRFRRRRRPSKALPSACTFGQGNPPRGLRAPEIYKRQDARRDQGRHSHRRSPLPKRPPNRGPAVERNERRPVAAPAIAP